MATLFWSRKNHFIITLASILYLVKFYVISPPILLHFLIEYIFEGNSLCQPATWDSISSPETDLYRFTVTNLPREYLAQIAISFFYYIFCYFTWFGIKISHINCAVQIPSVCRFLVGILEACLSHTQEEGVPLGTWLGREGRVPSLGL